MIFGEELNKNFYISFLYTITQIRKRRNTIMKYEDNLYTVLKKETDDDLMIYIFYSEFEKSTFTVKAPIRPEIDLINDMKMIEEGDIVYLYKDSAYEEIPRARLIFSKRRPLLADTYKKIEIMDHIDNHIVDGKPDRELREAIEYLKEYTGYLQVVLEECDTEDERTERLAKK